MTTITVPAVSVSMTLRLAANIFDDLPDLGRVTVSVGFDGHLDLQAVASTDHDKLATVDRLCAHLGIGPAHIVSNSAQSLHYGVCGAMVFGHPVDVVTILAKPEVAVKS
jgi:hypothetical protein